MCVCVCGCACAFLCPRTRAGPPPLAPSAPLTSAPPATPSPPRAPLQPLQSAHFRANIRWGPNGSGLDAAGAPIPHAPKGLEGLWRQPQDPKASLGSDPGVPAASGNYTGPSEAFILWLDDFIPGPTRSAQEKAADTYPPVLRAGDAGYQKLLFGIMEVASFLQITPLLDLATMRMATIFRKSGGAKGHDAPTEVAL